jgi:transposase
MRFSSLNVSPITAFFAKKLNELFADNYEIHLCYEACYIGYSLCRFLRKAGIHCDITAPSLMPLKAGVRVKTDRFDGLKTCRILHQRMLTPVYVPDKTDEEYCTSVTYNKKETFLFVTFQTRYNNHRVVIGLFPLQRLILFYYR